MELEIIKIYIKIIIGGYYEFRGKTKNINWQCQSMMHHVHQVEVTEKIIMELEAQQ